MAFQIFDIVERYKQFEALIPQWSDFVVRESGFISGQELLENPNISLYCLDPENQKAVFVETPVGIDLSQVPFYYMAQFQHASRVILAPFLDFHQLAEQVPLTGNHLVNLYSVGRCGSTLTSAAFNQANDVTSYSEPDVFTQLVAMRGWDNKRDAEIRKLLKASMHLTCKDLLSSVPAHKFVIKYRSYGIEMGDLVYAEFPEAKSIFIYRSAGDWLDSMVRVFGGEEAFTEEIIGFF